MPNTIQKQIEETITKHRKILAEATTFDEMAIRTEKLIREALNAIATKSAKRLEEEIMMLFVDVDAGGQVTKKETITINDVRKLFEALSKPKE